MTSTLPSQADTNSFAHSAKIEPPDAGFCFELSWEVCNKVGGIYTVVRTKAVSMTHHYGRNYIAVGPYVPVKAGGEFIEDTPPEQWRSVFDALRAKGIICHYGRWIIKGEPTCILIDFSAFALHRDEIKSEFWERYAIDSWGTNYFDYDEPLVWSVAAGMLIEAFAASRPQATGGRQIIAHCHEWLAAGALLYLVKAGSSVATVFTTHATVLGRALSTSRVDLYNSLSTIDPDAEAKRLGVHTKFQTERAAAQHADAFTTVSEITGIEAEHLLGKKPDLILPNGLDISAFPTYEELAIKHSLYKKKVREFLISYFFPSYSFDLENTLLFFISGRYEFHDKGLDILISALGRLNAHLRESGSQKTIVTFFWIPGNTRSIKPDLLQSRSFYEDILQTVDENLEGIRSTLIADLIAGKDANLKDVFVGDAAVDLKTKVMKFKSRKGLPPLHTHDLYNEDSDEILQAFKAADLQNRQEDRVKVIFYPVYLTGADGLLDTNNYESMMGCHLGIFPSAYEPWGYTPLECSALGVAAITTDLAGFGRYIENLAKTMPAMNLSDIGLDAPADGPPHHGIFVLRRFSTPDTVVVEQLTQVLEHYSSFLKDARINEKLEARRLATQCDWSYFVAHYVRAHNIAVANARKRVGGSHA